MKTFFTFITALLFSILLQAQPNEVSLVVTGEGATKEEATNNALRSAIEQAFGVFVSANTEILNDEIVKDEIATISSGNVKSFEIISYSELPSGNKSIALDATISIGHLIAYSKTHGSKAEFSGAVFGANLRLREERKKNESKIISDQISLLYSLRHVLFEPKIVVGTPKMKRIFQADYEKRERYNESIDTWVGDGCSFSLSYRGDGDPMYQRDEKSLIIKYPTISGQYSTNSGTNTYTLPIHISFIETSTGPRVLKDFLRVIDSISLSAEERMDYDNESIPYYPIEWVGKKYYFRDFISTILFSEIIRIINYSLFDDYSLSLSFLDGTSDVYYQKTSPSVLKPSGMRIFGKPCDTLSEYYIYSYNHPEYHTNGRPYLHCDIESKGKSNVARYTCAEKEDDILHSTIMIPYVVNLLSHMYDTDRILGEGGINGYGQQNALIVSDTHLRGLQLRYGNCRFDDFNLVLVQKGKNGTIDPPVVNLFHVEMPLTYDPTYDPSYHYRDPGPKPVSEFKSESIPKFLSGDPGSWTESFAYDIDLPLSTEQIQRLTGVEMISVN